jgi:hypothetical protein
MKITVDNYKKFKPSEFIRSFASDIEWAIKSGKKMDMGTILEKGDCLPCLGGIACMNFGIPIKDTELSRIQYNVAFLGDAIRLSVFSNMMYRLSRLYPSLNRGDHTTLIEKRLRNEVVHLSYKGTILPKQSMIERIHKIADIIASEGY